LLFLFLTLKEFQVKFKLALAVLIATTSSAAFAGQAEDQQVKFRQPAYSFTAWTCKSCHDDFRVPEKKKK
jgi:cytochrome c556